VGYTIINFLYEKFIFKHFFSAVITFPLSLLSNKPIKKPSVFDDSTQFFVFLQEVNMELAKFDELDSLLRGMLYIEQTNPNECYFWANPTLPEQCEKRKFDFSQPYPFLVRIQLLLKELKDYMYTPSQPCLTVTSE